MDQVLRSTLTPNNLPFGGLIDPYTLDPYRTLKGALKGTLTYNYNMLLKISY